MPDTAALSKTDTDAKRPDRSNLLARALEQHNAGRFETAEQLYRRFLATHPKHLVALNNAALVAKALGRHHVAIARFRKAIEHHPSAAQVYFNLANTLQELDRSDEAEINYRRAIALKPDYIKAHLNLGNVFDKRRQFDDAIACYLTALSISGDDAEIHANLGNSYRAQDRWHDALVHLVRAAALEPGRAEFHHNVGSVLERLRQFDSAIECYLTALSVGGDDAKTHGSLGYCYRSQNRFCDAVAHFTRAASLEPDRIEFHHDAGMALFELRDYAGAMASLRRVLEIDPGHAGATSWLMYLAQLTCDWPEVERLSALVRAATDKALASEEKCGEGPLESIGRDAEPRRNQAVAAALASQHIVAKPLGPSARATRADTARIKIGYLSVDFRDHAVAHVVAGLFKRHDRRRFEVTAYSYGPDDGSAWRQRIERECDRFVDLSAVGDDDAAQRIHDDTIDILIDLTVWTSGNRPRICALHPAAVQLQYLGFPGTSGAPFYDYAIVDRVVVPAQHREFWSEALIYMRDSYFMVDCDQPTSAQGFFSRSQFGLPEDAFVFCSFNQTYKITPVVFGAWMSLLAQVPASVLWLPHSSPEAEANLVRQAGSHGIDAHRLIFADRVADKATHLARLQMADLALDTLIYNGHTTTSDALWAGLPVVAVLGEHFASRVSASLLGAAGLKELVASDVDGYVELALRFAANAEWRNSVRSRLAAARATAPLFDTSRSVRGMEQAYEKIWAQFLSGAAPADIYV